MMDRKKVMLELHSINNLIRRFFVFSSHRKEIDSITGNNGWIICYLADNEHRDIYQKDIEDHFSITRSTVSSVLSLMEQKGLIQRQAVSQDARLKKIVLTDRAWKVKENMSEDAINLENILLRGFSDEEANLLQSYLQRMKENISSEQEKNGGRFND